MGNCYLHESQRRIELAELMRKNGWEVYEEVYCDEKKANSNGRFRLDIMARPPNFDKFIGIEIKLYQGCRQGGKFWESLIQTLDYRGKSFRGHKVEMWCIDLYHDTPDDDAHKFVNNTFESSWIFMQSLLQKLGIGMIKGKIDSTSMIFMVNDSNFIYHFPKKDFNGNTWYLDNFTNFNMIYERAIELMVDIKKRGDNGNE